MRSWYLIVTVPLPAAHPAPHLEVYAQPFLLQTMNTVIASTTPVPLLRQVLPTPDEVSTARRRLHYKAVAILAVSAIGYVGLVLTTSPWWAKLFSALLLVHGLVATATGIMHDANHGAFSASRRVNQLMSYTADALGASSWLWRQQHNVAHHHHTNIVGLDGDIDQAPFARLAPTQTWRRYHRYQHMYLWFLYGFMTIKWVLIGDLRTLVRLRRTGRGAARPSLATMLKIAAGKVLHLSWAVVVPVLYNPWHWVLVWYLACSWLVGFALAVIFQLAHCVDAAEMLLDEPKLTGDALAVHQLATTVDISCKSRPARAYIGWLMGGLDHQVEHHLAPRMPHTVYRTMVHRVNDVCLRSGLERRTHVSLFAALASHLRHLRSMGSPVGC